MSIVDLDGLSGVNRADDYGVDQPYGPGPPSGQLVEPDHSLTMRMRYERLHQN